MEIELKRCPFCGGVVSLLTLDGIENGEAKVINFDEELDCNYCYIHCYRCDTDIFHHNENARKVLEQWNKRISEENE